ncbi:hypothetical protein ACFFH2_02550 [Enterococcus devriesei]|uniref:Uncharacterized protein n=1 Tax=Enterococcus devriesei TaxID=319970 RepID=A0A1L8SP07_9ENTE|nr:hypothetical protein [Enterococcus devriesei]OJG33743.1 hypothetical protein RV00_GL000997 [Enterococcus devriesei]
MTENTTVNQINSVVTEMKMVELSNGRKIPVPRLTNKKVLQLVKFVAGDGMIIYSKFTDWRQEHTKVTPALDENSAQKKDENGNPLFDTKYPTVEEGVDFFLSEVPDEKIANLLAILLDKTPEETEEMDFFDTSLIIAEFLANTPIEKLTALVKKIRPKFRTMNRENQEAAVQQEAPQTGSVVPLKPSPQA